MISCCCRLQLLLLLLSLPPPPPLLFWLFLSFVEGWSPSHIPAAVRVRKWIQSRRIMPDDSKAFVTNTVLYTLCSIVQQRGAITHCKEWPLRSNHWASYAKFYHILIPFRLHLEYLKWYPTHSRCPYTVWMLLPLYKSGNTGWQSLNKFSEIPWLLWGHVNFHKSKLMSEVIFFNFYTLLAAPFISPFTEQRRYMQHLLTISLLTAKKLWQKHQKGRKFEGLLCKGKCSS